MNKADGQLKYRQLLLGVALIMIGSWLTSCADSKVESSSEAFSSAADVHADDRAIAETADIDALLEKRAAASSAKVFAKSTELIVREKVRLQARGALEAASERERKAYFGDLHVHTTYSFDGYAFGTMATPYDAYRFATGEAIKNPAGFDMQLSRPMDFYAVTDHAMFLGVVEAAADTSTAFSKNDFSRSYHDLNDPANYGTDSFSSIKRMATFSAFIPDAVQSIVEGDLDREQVLGVIRSAWEDTVDAAEQFNDPGHFTTFVAYEYTAATTAKGNLHRNVIFQGSDRLPREPFSRFHSTNPEDLWRWMDELRAKGVESLAIPHNSNGSNGQMFKLVDWAGNPLDDDYAEKRGRNEPIVEITQIKGTSETHPMLSTRDEWAGFEIMPYRVATGALSEINGSYVREALRNGLALEQQGIINPYQFGFIGSSDTHTAASQNDESAFVSKAGILSATAVQRGSVPLTGVEGELAYYGTKIASTLVPVPTGKSAYIKLNGDVYTNATGAPTYGASGLAAAWAEENTRESLYRAFRRKEVFATSGPRIQLRFFAGYGFDEGMVTTADGAQRAYANGVSMGGSFSAEDNTSGADGSPGFFVMAAADPNSAPLQRLQVVKGWVDAGGNTHEDVIDVACAGGAEVNAETKRCPDNGARVDISDCSINPETGAGQLSTLWHDPQFNPEQRAFYYARVLENPTCRWSTWDANRAGVPPRPDLATTIQERAWSSPIHYLAR